MIKRLPTRADHLRAAIAQEAARLMAEHGIQDYGVAKRKAAERYGVFDGPLLPRNVEIETALAAYQRLFGGRGHEENLQRLRLIAVRAMKLLAPFEPRLVGPVLHGTATAHSNVQLHLFAECAEAVHIMLMNLNIPHEPIERRVQEQSGRLPSLIPGLHLDMGEETIEALVFPTDGIRQPPLSPVHGKPLRRAELNEVWDLLETTRR